MSRRSHNLIAEAVAVNHAQVGKQQTLDRYGDHLEHYDAYPRQRLGRHRDDP